jgi:hypothetical protein
MAPVEIYLNERFITATGAGSSEIPVPGVPMVINYSGDECGAIVAIKHPDGERMTDFPLSTVGEEKLMRFELTVQLPIEKDRSGSVRVKRTIKFKRI